MMGQGVSGDYNVSVVVSGRGASKPRTPTANQYSYGVYIDSISPQQGILGGGNNITIKGQNFIVGDGLNKVFIGEAECLFVNVISDNEIACITPPSSNFS